MNAYFDTSALIPVVFDEPASSVATRFWDDADRLLSSRVVYPEARSALARAMRAGRMTRAQLRRLVADLDRLVIELDVVEVTDELASRAGELAEGLALRGYDAVHLAAAESVADADLVFVTGDQDLAAAATRLGLRTVRASQ